MIAAGGEIDIHAELGVDRTRAGGLPERNPGDVDGSRGELIGSKDFLNLVGSGWRKKRRETAVSGHHSVGLGHDEGLPERLRAKGDGQANSFEKGFHFQEILP
jgi:hypothetical protein